MKTEGKSHAANIVECRVLPDFLKLEMFETSIVFVLISS